MPSSAIQNPENYLLALPISCYLEGWRRNLLTRNYLNWKLLHFPSSPLKCNEMRGEVDDSIGTSLAMFGAVAMIMTKWQRQASSSEDLEGDFFGEDDEHFEAFVQSIPKVELHVHLDGSFDPAKLWCHMSKQPELIRCFPVEKKLPWARPEENPLQLR